MVVCTFLESCDQSGKVIISFLTYGTPAYRTMANDFLMELWKSQAISVEQLLQAGNFPFADELLQSLQSQKEQLEQGQVPQGISPALMQQAQRQADMGAEGQLQGAMQG